MIVAVVFVRMMKTTVDKIVNMIAVRNRLMATSGAVLVARAPDIWRAARRILVADRNDVLFYVVADLMFEVTIAKVVYVASVTDDQVAAVWTMTVGGIRGNGHFLFSSFSSRPRR